MSQDPRTAMYEQTMEMLKPALDRVASDPEFRDRLERTPLQALDEVGVVLDADTRAEFEGKRFSEFWAARQKAAGGPVENRELPPQVRELNERELEAVAGGLNLSLASNNLLNSVVVSYAPPYVPVGFQK